MEEKNKGTKRPKRNGTRPAKNSGKRIGKSRPEKADNARGGDPKDFFRVRSLFLL